MEELDDEIVGLKKYYPELDCIRGLSIIFLLFYHTDVAEYLDFGIFPSSFFNPIIFSFTVPVFFFLSGLGLTIKYRNQNFNLKDYYTSRFKFLLPAYLIWTFLIVSILYIGDIVIFNPINGNIFSNILNIKFIINLLLEYFFSAITGHVYTLWFVYILFIYYFLFPIIFKIFKNQKKKRQLIITISVFMITLLLYIINDILYDLFFIGENALVIYNYNNNGINFLIDLSFFFRVIPYFIYFLFGVFMAFYWEDIRNVIKKKMNISILLISLAIFSYFFLEFTQIEIIRSFKNLIFAFSSIFLLLIIFSNVSKWEQVISLERDLNTVENKKQKQSKNIRLYPVKFFYFNGKRSSGLYFTHRVIMAVVWIALFLIFNVKLWNPFSEDVNRTLAFLYSSLAFILTYLGCLILISIIRKLPKNEYMIGK